MPHHIEGRFRAVDQMDMDAFLVMLTDDHRFVFGGREPVVGKASARQQVGEFWSSITSLRHHIQYIHEAADGTVIVESLVDYERLDGKVVRVPCCDVFRMRGGQIAETWAYLDQSPVRANAVANS